MNEVQSYIKLPLCDLEKKRRFEFCLKNEFFSGFGDFDILKSRVEIGLETEKFEKFVSVLLKFSGEITVPCDRCLEDLDIKVAGTNRLTLVFEKIAGESDDDGENSEDTMYLGEDEEDADLSAYVYDSICLALPIQRVHGNDRNGKSLCNPEMLKYLANQDEKEKKSPFDILKNMNFNK